MLSESELPGPMNNENFAMDSLAELVRQRNATVDSSDLQSPEIDEPVTASFIDYLERLTGRSFEACMNEQGGRHAVIAKLEDILADFPDQKTLGAELALALLKRESHNAVMDTLGYEIAKKEAETGEVDFDRTEFTKAVCQYVATLMANRGERLKELIAKQNRPGTGA